MSEVARITPQARRFGGDLTNQMSNPTNAKSRDPKKKGIIRLQQGASKRDATPPPPKAPKASADPPEAEQKPAVNSAMPEESPGSLPKPGGRASPKKSSKPDSEPYTEGGVLRGPWFVVMLSAWLVVAMLSALPVNESFEAYTVVLRDTMEGYVKGAFEVLDFDVENAGKGKPTLDELARRFFSVASQEEAGANEGGTPQEEEQEASRKETWAGSALLAKPAEDTREKEKREEMVSDSLIGSAEASASAPSKGSGTETEVVAAASAPSSNDSEAGEGLPAQKPVFCIDEGQYCDDWAAIGECDTNRKYMRRKCRKACKVC